MVDRLSKEGLAAWEAHLEEDELARLSIDQTGSDVVVCLYSSRGDLLEAADRPTGKELPETIEWISTQATRFRVDVRSLEPELRTEYTLSYSLVRHPSAPQILKALATSVTNRAEELRRNSRVEAGALARQEYQRALQLWERLDDRLRKADLLYRLGEIERRESGDPRAAIKHFALALPYLADFRLHHTEAQTHLSLGYALLEAGRIEDASVNFLAASEKFARLGNLAQAATSRNQLAYALQQRGIFQPALANFGEAIGTWRQLGDQKEEATSLHNRGVLYWLLGKYAEARADLLGAHKILSTLPAPLRSGRQEAATLTSLGLVYLWEGEYRTALSFLDRALLLRHQEGDRLGEGVTQAAYGLTLRQLGRSSEAIERQRVAIRIFGDLGKSDQRLRALYNLGLSLADCGQHHAAILAFSEVLVGLNLNPDPAFEAAALFAKARIHQRLGEREESWRLISSALDRIETIRAGLTTFQLSSGFFSNRQDYYIFALDLLTELDQLSPGRGYAAAGFNVAERAKARSLLDLLNRAGGMIYRNAPPRLVERKRRLWSRIRELNSGQALTGRALAGAGFSEPLVGVAALQKELAEVEAELQLASPSLMDLAPVQPVSLKQIQTHLLASDTLLLFYTFSSKNVLGWLVGAESLKTFTISDGKRLERLALRAHALLSSPNYQANRVQAELTLTELSRALLEPILADLGTKRLCVIADGALQYVPFEALPVPSQEEPARAVPLILEREVITAPSASTLVALQSRQRNRRPIPTRIAVIADPVFSADDPRVRRPRTSFRPDHRKRKITSSGVHSQFRRLPFTRHEALQISTYLSPESLLLFLDFSASRDMVTSGILATFSHLHFATHAEISSEGSDLSRLALSLVDERGQYRDGFLYGADILELHLPAELVVLSACESGLGEHVPGEGIVGLPFAFLYAGSNKVIFTRWRVEDESTARLMAHFYEALLQGRKSPAASLREAQIAIWRRTPWPYYWAGFSLLGHWQ